MKKLFVVFFIFLYFVILSSVFALRTCWASGDPAVTEAVTEAAEVISGSPMPTEIAQGMP